MISKNQSILPKDFRAVQRQFERWRVTRPRITRIPDPLWHAALSLYPRYSLNRISRVLHLENTVLRDHLRLSARKPGEKATKSQRFVELSAGSGMASGEYCIEVEDGGGKTVRVRLSGFIGVEQVVEVVRRLRQETA